ARTGRARAECRRTRCTRRQVRAVRYGYGSLRRRLPDQRYDNRDCREEDEAEAMDGEPGRAVQARPAAARSERRKPPQQRAGAIAIKGAEPTMPLPGAVGRPYARFSLSIRACALHPTGSLSARRSAAALQLRSHRPRGFVPVAARQKSRLLNLSL